MRVIHKFQIQYEPRFTVRMPRYAKILAVACQKGVPFFWAEVNPDNQSIEKEFWLNTTGEPFAESSTVQHVGTFLGIEDRFVGHLYTRVSGNGDW